MTTKYLFKDLKITHQIRNPATRNFANIRVLGELYRYADAIEPRLRTAELFLAEEPTEKFDPKNALKITDTGSGYKIEAPGVREFELGYGVAALLHIAFEVLDKNALDGHASRIIFNRVRTYAEDEKSVNKSLKIK